MLGWLDALETAGIRPTVVQESHSEVGLGDEAAQMLLDSGDRPTAVLCFSDVIAYGVVQAANARGLRVPEDLSVVGFAAKGRAAAAALTAAIERSRTGAVTRVRHLLLPTELIVRDSTTKPRPPG